jgi:hypothetical protein
VAAGAAGGHAAARGRGVRRRLPSFWDESFTRLDDHLAQTEVCEVDLRVGGTYRYRWGIASRSSSCRLLGDLASRGRSGLLVLISLRG